MLFAHMEYSISFHLYNQQRPSTQSQHDLNTSTYAAGEDLPTAQFWEVHDYMCHLMDRWSDWAELRYENPAEELKERSSALKPEAFQKYTQTRKKHRESAGA